MKNVLMYRFLCLVLLGIGTGCLVCAAALIATEELPLGPVTAWSLVGWFVLAAALLFQGAEAASRDAGLAQG